MRVEPYTTAEFSAYMLRHNDANALMLQLSTSWMARCATCGNEEAIASNGGMLAAHELLERGWSTVAGRVYCPACGLI